MVKFAVEDESVKPYTVRNKGPVPKIGIEEDKTDSELDLAWLDDSRKHLFYDWSKGLEWHERLYAHATLNSARKNVKCKRPFEPQDDLDFVIGAAYCPMLQTFAEKTDVYLQKETTMEEVTSPDASTLRDMEVRKLLRNRIVVHPEQPPSRGYSILYSNGSPDGRPMRRENIYNVKLGIAADHTPQTNPGYSRTPSGAFYSI